MDIRTSNDRYHLQPAQLLTLRGARGRQVCCLAGCLWVTQHADPQDHVLQAVGVLQLATNRLVVIEAYSGASLELR